MSKGRFQDHYQWALRHRDDSDANALLTLVQLYRSAPSPQVLGLIEGVADRIEKKEGFKEARDE